MTNLSVTAVKYLKVQEATWSRRELSAIVITSSYKLKKIQFREKKHENQL